MKTKQHILSPKKPVIIKLAVTIIDAFIGTICLFAAITLRYVIEGKPIPGEVHIYAPLVFAASIIFVWGLLKTHKAIWRFTSLSDIRKLVQSVLLASVISTVLLFLFFNRAVDFPRSVPFIATGLFLTTLIFSRLIVMIIRNGNMRNLFVGWQSHQPGALLIGHSQSLNKYMNEIHGKSLAYQYNIIGMIELTLDHAGRTIQNIPILGEMDDLAETYHSLSIPNSQAITLIATDEHMDRHETAQLIRLSAELGAPLVRVNADKTGTFTPFEIADLIGRHQKTLDPEPVKNLIKGKRIVITGAGGTIGSAIAHQVMRYAPEMLSLLDISEYNLYELDRELTDSFPAPDGPNWRPYFADITNSKRIEEIFKQNKPHIVIHAAAKKHVRLGDLNPIETLNTNVFGTNVLLDMAKTYGAENFVLVSTDKAVEPSNIMGASKRLAEISTLSKQNGNSGLHSCAVRFGNVVSSNGSVIPLFEKQIAQGGPVTVTDKDVTRFFMTVKEAAELVLQAAAQNTDQYKDKNNIFVLEMGTPVNITKLARQLIRLRGKVPDKDIEIVFTGLKPGEKMEERLFSHDETLENTYINGILRVDSSPQNIKKSNRDLAALFEAVHNRDREAVRKLLKKLLPTYEPNGTLSMPDEV